MDRRPFAAAVSTAVLSTGLLVLAVWQGWLGPDVDRGANFCETGSEGWVRQPVNALSNLGFVVAGLAVGWHARRVDRLGAVLAQRRGLGTAMACLVVLLGPASAAMHATESALGGVLDLTSMYLVASFAAAYALLRWYHLSDRSFWLLFAGLVLACELTGLWPHEVPVVLYLGNVAFAALLVLAIVVEVRLHRRGPTRTRLGYGAAALATMLVAFVIWNLSKGPLCDPDSLLQGHGVWHLLGAVSAYLLFRLYASEAWASEE